MLGAGEPLAVIEKLPDTPTVNVAADALVKVGAAPADTMLNCALTAEVSAPSVATSVYVFGLLMERSLKVATPLIAATLVVPLSVPNPLCSPIVRDTILVSVVTTFPPASSTSTVTGGLIMPPAIEVDGCCPYTR